MVLPAPNLDDRRFQDLVDEAKRHVQRTCPEWTEHNVSDPGVTLIETFAQMVDQVIYRLNRVPDRHYVKFLDLLGVRLFPPTAARGTVTFWLAAPQPAPVVIREGVEVATARTDVEEAVVFTTTAGLAVPPCSLVRVGTQAPGGEVTDRTVEFDAARPVACFSERPQVGDALLIGLSDAVPSCAVLLRFHCPVGGVGIDPLHPPLVWEAWDGAQWAACELDRDGTRGFNKPGDVVLHVPDTHQASVLDRTRAGWLRCRVTDRTPGYRSSPQLTSASAATIGGTVPIVHAETVRGEELGLHDGGPSGRFTLARSPIVAATEPAAVEVSDGDGWTSWWPVRDFSGSGPTDRHYRLDPVSAELEFGPAVRQPDGSVRQYGAVPDRGAMVRMSTYRTGGGRRGNLARGMIRVLRTSVPFVSSVENRHPATGGVDGETVENARRRGPLELRSTGRAVTADDFEQFAREAAPDAARVRCVPVTSPGGGGVRLLVVPRLPVDELGRIGYDELARPSAELLQRIATRLDERRLVGTRLVVEPPAYQGVTVVARLRGHPGADPDGVRDLALQALYAHLSPLDGGPDGDGWPFGRAVQAFELSAVLAGLAQVAGVDELLLFPAQPGTGERGRPVTRLDLEPNALVHSFQHQVRVDGAR